MALSVTAFRIDDTPRMNAARHIRETVFCHEQGISPADEWDDHDPVCEHFVLYTAQTPIGTARVRPTGGGAFKIERMAVMEDYRDIGAGTFLLRAILTHVGNAASVVLHAQAAVGGFYRKLGFEPEGDIFEEAGIPHIRMTLRT
ncbi:MAG: GNAT family N-acetyltransferase [Rhodospirillaceae bacterium]|nr:GNAT family N-acetyltransferase [Rhodospirillaceae bacterium]